MSPKKMATQKGEAVARFSSAAEWTDWLDRHHEQPGPIWIQYAKKGSGVASVTYPEALDAALCFGWIDGQVARLDEQFYLQRFTPRRPRSRWSKINVAKAEALIAAGRMQPAGLREVMAAKADGRWAEAYSSPGTAEVPADLVAALDADGRAKGLFAEVSRQDRYAILYRLESIKRPETRARVIAQFVESLTDNRVVQPRSKRQSAGGDV